MTRTSTPYPPENTDFLCSNFLTNADVVGHGFDLTPRPPSLPGKGETPLAERETAAPASPRVGGDLLVGEEIVSPASPLVGGIEGGPSHFMHQISLDETLSCELRIQPYRLAVELERRPPQREFV